MNNIYNELSIKILNSDKFDVFYSLVKDEMLNSILSEKRKVFKKDEIKLLIEPASIMACSSMEEYKRISYLILVLLHLNNESKKNKYENLKTISEMILIRLGNFPAYSLFQKSIENDNNFKINENRLELPAYLKNEVIKKILENKITIGEKDSLLTDFQKILFNELDKNKNFSFSAPTSAGKSYLLILFVINQIIQNSSFCLVYLVPTKALINQVKKDFKKALNEFKINDVEISFSSITLDMEEIDNNSITHKKILILTQERLNSILSSNPNYKIDLLIIDEA